MAGLLTTVRNGDHRAILVAMRESLAAKLEDTVSGRDYAAMMKSLADCEARIYEYDEKHGAFAPKEEESPAARARARHKKRVADDG